ncbi:MAG: DUF503 domain-containing protein [Planctomycetes bacterium]|nr:DUF503 domain-containing protein [Planctomycetota bacterium]
MVIGALSLRLSIPGARSLKEKRRVVKSLVDRIRARFNVACSEVEDLDLHRSAVLGVAAVGNEGRVIDAALCKVVDLVRRDPDAALVDYDLELFRGAPCP